MVKTFVFFCVFGCFAASKVNAWVPLANGLRENFFCIFTKPYGWTRAMTKSTIPKSWSDIYLRETALNVIYMFPLKWGFTFQHTTEILKEITKITPHQIAYRWVTDATILHTIGYGLLCHLVVLSYAQTVFGGKFLFFFFGKLKGIYFFPKQRNAQ